MSGGTSAAAQGGNAGQLHRTTLFPTSRGGLRNAGYMSSFVHCGDGLREGESGGTSDAEAAFSTILSSATTAE